MLRGGNTNARWQRAVFSERAKMSHAYAVLLNRGVRNQVCRLRCPHGQQPAFLVGERKYRAFPIDNWNHKALGSVFQITHPPAIAIRADSTLDKRLSSMLAIPNDRTVIAADDLLVKRFQGYAQMLQEPLRYDVLLGAAAFYRPATTDAFH